MIYKHLFFLTWITIIWYVVVYKWISWSNKIVKRPKDQLNRDIVIMSGTAMVFSLVLATVVYRIFTLIYCVPIWIFQFPILTGDFYYSRKRCKEAHADIVKADEDFMKLLEKERGMVG